MEGKYYFINEYNILIFENQANNLYYQKLLVEPSNTLRILNRLFSTRRNSLDSLYLHKELSVVE